MNLPEGLSPIAHVGIEAALLAGRLLRAGYGTRFAVQEKEGIHNLVTEYDFLAEKTIMEHIRSHWPASRFLAEESGESGEDGLLWIIDPLDGTVNFAHKIPFFAVSIAAQKDKQTLFGAVYQPMTEELFIAEKGRGAFLNGKPIRVSEVAELKKSFLATGFPYNIAENPSHNIEHFTDILRLGIPIRRLGVASLDLCYTAAGRFEGFFEVSLYPWDCAAGNLLIEEAGGRITGWNNHPFDLFACQSILASNGKIHDALSKVLTHPC